MRGSGGYADLGRQSWIVKDDKPGQYLEAKQFWLDISKVDLWERDIVR